MQDGQNQQIGVTPTPIQQAQFEGGDVQVASANRQDDTVTWRASEYVHHEKSVGWYAVLAIAGGGLIAGGYLLEGVLTGILLACMIATIFIYAQRKPRTLNYEVSQAGINIGGRHYDYFEFSSFAITGAGPISSIELAPVNRFSQPINLYFSIEDAGQIYDYLSSYLPQIEYRPDIIERITKALRF